MPTTSNVLPSAPIPSVSQPFKPVFIVSPRKIKKEENAIIPNFANDSTKNEFIQCEMSQLQVSTKFTLLIQNHLFKKDLFEAVDYLMSLSENEQQNLKVQLFNHPFLLFARIQQLAAPFANKASGKKARVIFITNKIEYQIDFRRNGLIIRMFFANSQLDMNPFTNATLKNPVIFIYSFYLTL